MLKDIVEVRVLGERRLRIRFEDGVEGDLDVSEHIPFDGVFADLRDPAYFARIRVEPDLGTIVWPNGADLDPDVLYALITGEPIPDYARPSSRGPSWPTQGRSSSIRLSPVRGGNPWPLWPGSGQKSRGEGSPRPFWPKSGQKSQGEWSPGPFWPESGQKSRSEGSPRPFWPECGQKSRSEGSPRPFWPECGQKSRGGGSPRPAPRPINPRRHSLRHRSDGSPRGEP
jgi:hypothetical protein